MSFSELHNAQRTQNTARYAEERKTRRALRPAGKNFPAAATRESSSDISF